MIPLVELRDALHLLPWPKKERFIRESEHALIRMHVARAEAAIEACPDWGKIPCTPMPSEHECTLTGIVHVLHGLLLESSHLSLPEDVPYTRLVQLRDDVRSVVAAYGIRRIEAWVATMQEVGCIDATEQVLALRDAQHVSADGAPVE